MIITSSSIKNVNKPTWEQSLDTTHLMRVRLRNHSQC